MRRTIPLLAVLGASGVAASAVSAGAEGTGALRFDARLAASGFTTQDHPPAGRSPGDTLQFRDRLSRGGEVVGRDAGICTRVSPDEQTCSFTLVLSDGRIVAHGLMRDGNRPKTIPVVGGTGAYAGARGTFLVTDAASVVARYEVRLD